VKKSRAHTDTVINSCAQALDILSSGIQTFHLWV